LYLYISEHSPVIPYHAYVLRLWSDDQVDGHTTVRVALLDPRSGRRIGFGSLSALVDYLEGVTGAQEHVTADMGVVDASADT
jgi:hypothetical protein